jgi:hypothetical protein
MGDYVTYLHNDSNLGLEIFVNKTVSMKVEQK